MAQEENTKAVIDNSDSTLIEAYDREIKRLEELEWTLGKEFLNQPNKELLALDLWKFLEEFPQLKVDIEHYIRHRLRQLRIALHNKMMSQLYRKIITDLEQQLKNKNDTELH